MLFIGSDVKILLWHYFVHQATQYPVPEISEGEFADIYQSTIRAIIGWQKSISTVMAVPNIREPDDEIDAFKALIQE